MKGHQHYRYYMQYSYSWFAIALAKKPVDIFI